MTTPACDSPHPQAGDIFSENSVYVSSLSLHAQRIKQLYQCRFNSFILIKYGDIEDVYGIYPEDKSISPFSKKRIQLLRQASFKELPEITHYESFKEYVYENRSSIGCACLLH